MVAHPRREDNATLGRRVGRWRRGPRARVRSSAPHPARSGSVQRARSLLDRRDRVGHRYRIGERGAIFKLYGNRGRPVVLPEEDFPPEKYPSDIPPQDHYHDWVDAILEGRKACDEFSHGGPLTEAVLLGNVAGRFPGQTLEFDARTQWNNDYPGWLISDIVVGNDADRDGIPDVVEENLLHTRIFKAHGDHQEDDRQAEHRRAIGAEPPKQPPDLLRPRLPDIARRGRSEPFAKRGSGDSIHCRLLFHCSLLSGPRIEDAVRIGELVRAAAVRLPQSRDPVRLQGMRSEDVDRLRGKGDELAFGQKVDGPMDHVAAILGLANVDHVDQSDQ
jgi:hypothetical protein